MTRALIKAAAYTIGFIGGASVAWSLAITADFVRLAHRRPTNK